MAGHVTNTATKFEDPTTICSWVTSYNVSHWIPLKMRTRPLRMRRITWPVSRGSKTITFLESLTPICLFTIQLLIGLRRRLRVVYSRAVPCKPFSGHLAAILFYANYKVKNSKFGLGTGLIAFSMRQLCEKDWFPTFTPKCTLMITGGLYSEICLV